MLLLGIWLINKIGITVSSPFESRVKMTGVQMQDKLKDRKVKKSSNSVLRCTYSSQVLPVLQHGVFRSKQ